jgi:hypothetical protein
MAGPKRDEVTGEWRTEEKRYNLCSALSIILVIK